LYIGVVCNFVFFYIIFYLLTSSVAILNFRISDERLYIFVEYPCALQNHHRFNDCGKLNAIQIG